MVKKTLKSNGGGMWGPALRISAATRRLRTPRCNVSNRRRFYADWICIYVTYRVTMFLFVKVQKKKQTHTYTLKEKVVLCFKRRLASGAKGAVKERRC